MGYCFHFSSLYPAKYMVVYVLAYLNLIFNFKAALALPITARSAQTQKV